MSSENICRCYSACPTKGASPYGKFVYLEDGIAMHEGRCQRYGTRWLEDHVDGRILPCDRAEPDYVNDLRAEMGLDAMQPIPERGPELCADQQEAIYENQRWWEIWFISKGWRV